nr:transposase domain-containing protein [Geoalkalibacter sp.]
MKNSQPMFPGFHLQTLRRKPRSEQQKLAERLALLQRKTFKQIGEVFEKFIPRQLLKPEKEGAMSRRRLFSKENTFWAFFSQVLDADGGCKEVIRKLQSYASLKGITFPSSSTSSYCTARKKLDIQTLAEIFGHTAGHPEGGSEIGRLNGRRVIVVDGTGISMPDTSAPGIRTNFRIQKRSGSNFRKI